MNGLYDKIKNRSKDEIKSFVLEALTILKMDSVDSLNIGFNDENNMFFYHGFIPFKSRVSFATTTSKTYLLDNTAYYYEFADFISDVDIKSQSKFVEYLSNFMMNYFGNHIIFDDTRDEYFDTMAFQTSSSDQDYYDKLNSIDLVDFKNKGIAQSSERAVMAQNIMSLFGIDSYICFGVMSHGINSHISAFNIAMIDNKYYILDFDSLVHVIKDGNIIDYRPFFGDLGDSTLESLLSDRNVVSYDDYDLVNGEKKNNNNYRRYSVGTFVKNKNVGI